MTGENNENRNNCGKFQNKEFNIVAGDFKKKTAKRKDFEKLALKYLAPDYTYDV